MNSPHMTWDDTNGNWTLSPTIAMSWWEETNVTDVSNCTDYCSNNCGDCSREFICYAESSDALSTPEGGVCNRHFVSALGPPDLILVPALILDAKVRRD